MPPPPPFPILLPLYIPTPIPIHPPTRTRAPTRPRPRPQRLLTLQPLKRPRLHHHRTLPRPPTNRQILQRLCLALMHDRDLRLELRPAAISFAFVRAALQLPDAVLDPALDARAEGAAEAGEVYEEFEEG